jgi:hypothetical protein
MTTERFWQLIELSRMAAACGQSQLDRLETALLNLPRMELVEFEATLWDLLSLSYRREIWAVATIIQPKCSHGSFDAARAWMVLEGEKFFEQVMTNSETLAKHAPRGSIPWVPDGGRFLKLARRIYQRMTGEDLPTLPRKIPHVLKGERWTNSDLPELYPALWKKYRS